MYILLLIGNNGDALPENYFLTVRFVLANALCRRPIFLHLSAHPFMYSVYSSTHRHCINYRSMTESYLWREYPLSEKDYGKEPSLRGQLRKHVCLLRSGKNGSRPSRGQFSRMVIRFSDRIRIVCMS